MPRKQFENTSGKHVAKTPSQGSVKRALFKSKLNMKLSEPDGFRIELWFGNVTRSRGPEAVEEENARRGLWAKARAKILKTRGVQV